MIYANGEIIKTNNCYVWTYYGSELRIMLAASSMEILHFKIDTFLSFDKNILSKTEKLDNQKILLNDTKTLKDFTSGEGEQLMPPKYSDGSFRLKQNGLIEYRFMHIDKRYSVYGHSKNECFNKRTNLISGKKEIKQKKADLVLDEWLNKWYLLYKENKNSENWNKTSKYLITKYISPKLGKKLIANLNGIELQNTINELSDTPNTQKKVAQILNGSLKKAVKLRLIKYNPMDSVEIDTFKSKSYRALQIDEQQQVYQACTDKKYQQFFFFCCCTGIRVTRALEIKYSDFDFKRQRIQVYKKQRKGLNEYYYIPFSPELIKELPQKGKIFEGLTYDSVKSYFRRAYTRANIKGANQHSWRHTFISNCNHLQIPYKTIQTWAGHATLSMTMDTYTELLEGKNSVLLEYIKKLKEFFVPKVQ